MPIAKPLERPGRGTRERLTETFLQPIRHGLLLPGEIPAHNTNSLGRVPDSSWFQNRIGVRALSAQEVERGPGRGGPDQTKPWTVVRAKAGGTTPGFVIEDARGDRYLIKLDLLHAPEVESGAEVVAQRLLWAVGYHVPDNQVVHFARRDLKLDARATRRLADGTKVAFTQAELEELLTLTARTPGGELRAVASKYLDGEPVGGYSMQGVREDDRNDRVPHEHRREVRAQAVFFQWLGHTDVKVDNTLDMWTEHPDKPGYGHLTHYILDFSKALGAWGVGGYFEHDGWTARFDYLHALGSLFTLGLWVWPWEGIEPSSLRGVGRFEALHFQPGYYSSARPYVPFYYMDRLDALWAADILARLRPEHIAAAVRAGRYSDPRTSAYLVATLLARQRAILDHWFRQVSPLSDFTVRASGNGWRVCGRDLSLAHRFADADATRYRIEAFDHGGAPLGHRRELAGSPRGDICQDGLEPAELHDGYTLVVYTLTRANKIYPPVTVHVARDPSSGQPRVVGVERR